MKRTGTAHGRFHRLHTGPEQLNQQSDAYLVQVARAGDHEAFRVLLARHTGLLTAYVSRRMPRPEDAEDVLQDAFLGAYRDLSRLDKPARFGAWLLAIARTRVNDWYRRRKLQPPAAPELTLIETVDEAPGPGDTTQAIELEAAIIDVLAGLKDKHRLPLEMKLFEDLNATEIAARLRIRPGTARMRLHRGLEELRKRLKRRGIVPWTVPKYKDEHTET